MNARTTVPASVHDVATDQFAARLRRHGDHLRSVLRAHDMTTSQAARVCHASRSTFARRLASGNLLIEWLWDLAATLDVDVLELVAPETRSA